MNNSADVSLLGSENYGITSVQSLCKHTYGHYRNSGDVYRRSQTQLVVHNAYQEGSRKQQRRLAFWTKSGQLAFNSSF
jgi:hypothetical protein